MMIQKTGKPPEQVESYRPISLLPVMSKVLERLFLKRLYPILEQKTIISDHQFGFRKQHGTVEQVHRLVENIHEVFENKKYCTGAFLDISQAFDKVWHEALLHKLLSLTISSLHPIYIQFSYQPSHIHQHKLHPFSSCISPFRCTTRLSPFTSSLHTLCCRFPSPST